MGTCFDLLLWFIRVCITIFLELLISESLIAVLHVFRWVPASWFVLSLLPLPRAKAAERELRVQWQALLAPSARDDVPCVLAQPALCLRLLKWC